MNRRCVIRLALAISTIVLIAGCSYVSYKEYYSATEQYSEIWKLAGFRYSTFEDGSFFFPKEIENLEVKDFYCRYDEQIPLGEGIQVFLGIQYTDEKIFNDELERILTVAFNCNEYFEKAGFSAYATRLGDDYSYEYALLDKEQQVIYYIYLQSLPKDEVEFDHSFLPIGYTENGKITSATS
ncbi:MAG: hypothetical protein E7269_00395 [Lachnospiraceae bacterium]|nr:hypothetical protein [Lachnospiraceae bacterium]